MCIFHHLGLRFAVLQYVLDDQQRDLGQRGHGAEDQAGPLAVEQNIVGLDRSPPIGQAPGPVLPSGFVRLIVRSGPLPQLTTQLSADS
eukprot:2094015-Pyramimonas_sp.AAC.1